MTLSKTRFLALAATLALMGCSAVSDSGLSSSGAYGSGSADGQAAAPAERDSSSLAAVSGRPTETAVGRKVQDYRSTLQQLQGNVQQRNEAFQVIRGKIAQDGKLYHETVAAMNTRLQVGSTPGNPILQSQWELSQKTLNEINQQITQLNHLAREAAADSATASYLRDSVRASFSLSGAVEEDHAQLRVLEDETNRTIISIERLLSDVARDISLQQSYVSNEQANLTTLATGIKNGHLYESGLDRRASAKPGTVGAALLSPARPAAAPVEGRRPVMVIRFDRPDVAYEQALRKAVPQILNRRPQAAFDIVAVTPPKGDAAEARRNAENVMKSLAAMGLPSNRLRLSATSSQNAVSNEVHLFVR